MNDIPRSLAAIVERVDPWTLLATLLADSLNPLQVFAPDGDRIYVNDTFRRVYCAEPSPQYNLLDDPALMRAGVIAQLRRAFAGERVELPTIWYDPEGGGAMTEEDGPPRYLRLRALPICDPDGAVVFVIAQIEDLTEQRRTSEEKERLRDQFIAVAAHELRTPLTTLLGYSQLLSRRLKNGAPHADLEASVENILRAGRRLDVLVNQLVDVSRLEHGSLTLLRSPCDLSSIARRVVEDVAFRYPRPTVALDAPVSIEGDWDGGRLEQALSSLLDNAVKHGRPEGTVWLRLEESPEAVTVTVESEGGTLEEPDLQRVFDRYYRAHPHQQGPTPGLGLGLFMAREVVEAHGGTIRAGNRAGGGLTVTFTLPKT